MIKSSEKLFALHRIWSRDQPNSYTSELFNLPFTSKRWESEIITQTFIWGPWVNAAKWQKKSKKKPNTLKWRWCAVRAQWRHWHHTGLQGVYVQSQSTYSCIIGAFVYVTSAHQMNPCVAVGYLLGAVTATPFCFYWFNAFYIAKYSYGDTLIINFAIST